MIHEYLEMAWRILSQPVASHLIQSTLCAVVAALLAFTLRGNRAETRYWIWLAASLKFLIPFSLFLELGSRLSEQFPAAGAPQLTLFIDYLGYQAAPAMNPIPASFRASIHEAAEAPLAAILLSVWFCGFAAVIISALWRWHRMRSVLKTSVAFPDGSELQTLLRVQQRAGVRGDIRLTIASSTWEPGVFGIFRPVLLLPAGVSDYLDPAQLEAILAHEIIHIRRRDNLLAALQMSVEALFWFHPLVWWLGARLLTERERACDEEVLRLGSEPETYAEGILRVCKLCLASPLPCVSGITGSDLKRRIEQIMSHNGCPTLDRARRLLLTCVASATVLIPVAIGLLSAPGSAAQQIGRSIIDTGDLPSFAVASIKPTDPHTAGLHLAFEPGGRLTASNLTLRFLIKIAYDLRDDQIGGGPAWLGEKRYDIQAKCDPPLLGDPRNLNDEKRRQFELQMKLRLRSLLADRFQLKLKEDTKEMLVYHLTVGRNGHKMKELFAPPPGNQGLRMSNTHAEANYVDTDLVARFLGEQTHRLVLDKTGLTGKYAFKLDWAPDPPADSGAPDAQPQLNNDLTGPSISTAVQEQLGLKLESHRGPAEFVIVDRAELPGEN